MKKSDLIIHPVRFRILRDLAEDDRSTQEIAARLSDIPKSSIYRHLKILLEGQIIEVAETRTVNGIVEKRYRALQPPLLEPGDLVHLNADDHVRLFTTYALTLIQDFAAYTSAAEAATGAIDFLADRVGYREATFWATAQELDVALAGLTQAFMPLLQNEASDGRRPIKLATVLHPFQNGLTENGRTGSN